MKRNLATIVPIISVFLLAGCFSAKNETTKSVAPKTTAPKVSTIAPKNSDLEQKLSLLKSGGKTLGSDAIESVINLPVGKTSLSISVPSKFSAVKKKQQSK